MKGYYKNWYQHYLKLEEEKEKEMQRGYYSNLAPKKSQDKVENLAPAQAEEEQSKDLDIQEVRSVQRKRPVKRQKKRFGILLPIVLILGFAFIWYQMDIGPARHLVNEALVFAGVREEAIDVVSYHEHLLDLHVLFVEEVNAYLNGESGTSFGDVQLIYDDIRNTHMRVIEVSEQEHEEVIRLWLFKISSTHQMMHDLASEEDATESHAQFVIDQREIGELIRAELMIGEDL